MKLYVFPNLDKKNCRSYTKTACEILINNDVSVYMSYMYKRDFSDVNGIEYIDNDCVIEECDFILAVGGDGTILRCSDLARKYKKPLLGLNCGRLGFMATLEHDEINLLNDFCKGKYVLDKRMMIDADVYYENGSVNHVTALNDVVLTKNHGCKIADFTVSKNNNVISSLRADGLVFSTPTGSTAYSLSAGGPIIEPDMECIEFTQICPHSLFARSMLFSDNSVIDVHFKTDKNSEVILTVDGVEIDKLSDNDYVKILKSDDYVEIVDIKGGSFFKSVNRKLMQPFKEILEEV
ncbi:MAG: NAD(+)/NADH kinase [Ruminococcus sp.]|nr:NAD(+)/NADH kinase [Ruminococcus sp.]